MGKKDDRLFVLGGNDAEMELVKGLLARAGLRFIQPEKGWGDHKFSPEKLGLKIDPEQYGNDRRHVPAIVRGVSHAYFVECQPAEWPTGTSVVVIDHHGDRSGEPASVLQVIVALAEVAKATEANAGNAGGDEKEGLLRHAEQIREALNLSGSTRRWVELIAANDAGYIPAMLALGASAEEIARVRALERSCQGVTPEQESAAEVAIAAPPEHVGQYRVIRLAHSKCATATDRLFRSGQPERVLVLSGDGEVNVFGDGATCVALKERFEGWNGGSGLGDVNGQAFWGGYPSHDELVSWFKERFTS